MAVLRDCPDAPSFTELVAAHLRKEKGRARVRPPLSLGELFERCSARYSPTQARSAGALASTARFFCRRLGADTAVESIPCARFAKALAVFAAPETWNSHYRRLRLALNWAVGERLIDRSPLEGLEPRHVDYREPAFFAPEKVERIMRTAEAHPGPLEGSAGMCLALGFFAGVRTAEIFRARWEDLDLEASTLRVPRPKGWTRGQKPRLVQLEDNAVAWIARWRDWTKAHGCGRAGCAGPIVANARIFGKWKARCLAPVGLSWGNDAAHNVMRHTYATMHVAAFRDAAATALNLGHGSGTEILERHYRGLVAKSVAAPFWRIMPAAAPLPPPEPLPGRGHRTDLRCHDGGDGR